MHVVQILLIGFIALQHLGFLILEMFLWTRPIGLKIFRQSLEHAQISKKLAANQGLYNGFLAMGLLYALSYPDRTVSYNLVSLFLTFVLVAGIYGGYSVSRRIWIIQALPALIAMVLLFMFRAAYFPV